MRLSDDKIRHITHVILKALLSQGTMTPLTDDGTIRREMRTTIERELKIAENIEEKVTKKLESYSKKIYEGSSEWEVLYQKFFEEEVSKKGLE
ncbi:MAG TPA: DUF507 family protein [Nitrospirae bacterium]|nr:hypothetical protein BMS3Bbin09_01651 [bacterium BMS3Bbin09]HDO67604.1 DUF507 family protein [Nitrospirota bacterium]HDZ84684.1 DUF507 family protein [Nitrospirota bacterium]HEW81778.1 DUF507 family protein [Nitrospirota bacterium]